MPSQYQNHLNFNLNFHFSQQNSLLNKISYNPQMQMSQKNIYDNIYQNTLNYNPYSAVNNPYANYNQSLINNNFYNMNGSPAQIGYPGYFQNQNNQLMPRNNVYIQPAPIIITRYVSTYESP